jgi:uncharacterized protein
MIDLETNGHGVIIPVRAHAGARQTAVLGERQGMLRVAVTAAPEKGKANRAIIALLSETLNLPKSAVELISGETAAHKRFMIHDTTLEEIRNAISRAC